MAETEECTATRLSRVTGLTMPEAARVTIGCGPGAGRGAAGAGGGVGGVGGTAAGVGGIVAGEGHVCSTALGDEACVGGGRGRATSQADGAVARGGAIATVRGAGTTRSSSRRKSSEA